MIKVKGIFNGTTIDLLEPIFIPTNTAVEVTIETTDDMDQSDAKAERAFLEHLLAIGMISHIPSGEVDPTPFTPIFVPGKPVSESIIEDRG